MGDGVGRRVRRRNFRSDAPGQMANQGQCTKVRHFPEEIEMNRGMSLRAAAVIVTILGLSPGVAAGQAMVSEEASIKEDIIARYRSFEGPAEEQTWEKWQDYFLRSPSIANMHGDRLELGWEAYREGSVPYYQRPVERRAAVRFEGLQVHVIDGETAWVTGDFMNIIGEREMHAIFYDMLIKTPDGWRVFFSYVAPPYSG